MYRFEHWVLNKMSMSYVEFYIGKSFSPTSKQKKTKQKKQLVTCTKQRPTCKKNVKSDFV